MSTLFCIVFTLLREGRRFFMGGGEGRLVVLNDRPSQPSSAHTNTYTYAIDDKIMTLHTHTL